MPAQPDPPSPARARARALADEALARGQPTAWFDLLYREAGSDPARIPWADGAPNPDLISWARCPGALEGVRRAAVVGCGLGDDAEFLATLGLEVLAFDVSPAAVEWAKRRHPATRVHYEVGDLFALPAAWRAAFDLAVEVNTLQALPLAVRDEAARAIQSLLAPRGLLFLSARLRDDGPGTPPYDERASGPPWPLGRRELLRLLVPLSVGVPLREVHDTADPSIFRGAGVWVAKG